MKTDYDADQAYMIVEASNRTLPIKWIPKVGLLISKSTGKEFGWFIVDNLDNEVKNGTMVSIVIGDYKKGEYLFKAGEPANYFYVLQQGRVRVIVGLAGYTITMASNAGESFGWSCLVGFDSYTATAECLTLCTLAKIEKEKLLALLEQDPAS